MAIDLQPPRRPDTVSLHEKQRIASQGHFGLSDDPKPGTVKIGALASSGSATLTCAAHDMQRKDAVRLRAVISGHQI